jgi:putative membrane protein (TIGR04086 family)
MEKNYSRVKGETNDIMVPIKNLLLAYLMTLIILLVLAFLLYKVGLTEKAVSVAMILTYAGSTFLAGFLTGKKMGKMKFLWGLAVGTAYFVVLVILSLIGGHAGTMFGKVFFTTLLLCAGGGMLGGMIS